MTSQNTEKMSGKESGVDHYNCPSIKGVDSLAKLTIDYFSFCALIVSIVVAFIFLPKSISEWYAGRGRCKNVMTIGVLSSFLLGAVTYQFFKYGLSKEYYFAEVIFWLWCAVSSRIWMSLVFRHIYWGLELPNRSGSFTQLRKEAQDEVLLRSKRMEAYMLISFCLCVVACAIQPTRKNHHKFSKYSELDLFLIHITSFLFYFIYKFFDIIMLYDLLLICYSVDDRSLPGQLKRQLRLCCAGEILAFGVCLCNLIVFCVHRDGFITDVFLFENSISKEKFGYCAGKLPVFTFFPFKLSTISALLTLFPFTLSMLLKPISSSCIACWTNLDEYAEKTDQWLCCSTSSSYISIDHANNLWSSTVNSFLDFGLEDVSTHSQTSGRRSDVNPEQAIMKAVGLALENTDTYPLIIPPDFIKIHVKPFAAGGFGQVHKGVFCGQQVAVKKVFTQLSAGLLEEFNHEVRILNNLRGMPHIMLLHGVSFQIDQGERVFIMVLEWCPLSLAKLIHPDVKNHNTPTTNSSESRNWLKQALLKPHNRGEVDLESQSSNEPDSRDNTTMTRQQELSPLMFLAIMRQLVNVITYIHFKGYVHRDLKPQNILFANPSDLGSSLRICDFGTARITDATTGRCSLVDSIAGISPLYSPPEAIYVPYLDLDDNRSDLPGQAAEEDEDEEEEEADMEGAYRTVNDTDLDGDGIESWKGDHRKARDFYDGRAFDMYSLGIIMWEVWHQEIPRLVPPNHSKQYSGAASGSSVASSSTAFSMSANPPSSMDLLRQTVEGHRPSFSRALSVKSHPFGMMPLELEKLVTALWHQDPVKRPSAEEVKKIINSQQIENLIDQAQNQWNSRY